MSIIYRNQNAHRMVAQLAEEMANEVYEVKAMNNEFYGTHHDRQHFIRLVAPELRVEARQILASMLHPDAPGYNTMTEKMREDILQAITFDKIIPDHTWPESPEFKPVSFSKH